MHLLYILPFDGTYEYLFNKIKDKDVNEYVHLNRQIIARVLEVDVPRKRIQLKLYK